MAEIELRLHNPIHDSSEDDPLADRKIKLELEGQCKIIDTKLLEISYLKIIFLTLPMIISIVGLFLLKYYKTIRAKVFYWDATHETATHIFVKGNGHKEQQIVSMENREGHLFFMYKCLKYELLPNGHHVPVAVNYEKELEGKIGTKFIEKGLTCHEAYLRKELFGKNEHIVEPPKYFDYMYEILTEPYFIIQYLASTIYIIQKLIEPAILLLTATIVTTSINYLLLYISYRKIKQMAEVVVEVDVLRDGNFSQMPSTQLVPGDIFIPKKELFCDVIVVNGEVYVNQANLTGESIPIGKFALESYSQLKKDDTSKWIFEGSQILSSSNALVMVMHTGYSSKRGRILRKILHRSSKTPHFFRSCIYFLLINWVVGMIIYLGTMSMRLANNNLQPILIFLNFLLILTFAIPPSCPIYFNVVYSFSLIRLKWKDILGTEPEKTVEAAHLKTMCFDKTGTLTEDKVEVNKVFKFLDTEPRNITNRNEEERGIDQKIFGCCHTVKQFEGKMLGDEIDLKMFIYSHYKLQASSEKGSLFQVSGTQDWKDTRLRILKIYQYQSKFQSMSVLVHDKQCDKYYICVKGAPQIIHNNSTIKYGYFEGLLQNVSYGGFRTIGYGYKQIPKNEVDKWINESRENFMSDIWILGLLVFQNKLKKDSEPTIALLKEAGIDSRIITGDNIYIAIETAIRCGILTRDEQITVIEGKDQKLVTTLALSEQNVAVKRFSFREEKIHILKELIQYEDYLSISTSVVIDNDFLKLESKFTDFELTPKIKVYSRISPENKALVVRTLKNAFIKDRKQMSFYQRALSVEMDKVGMIGDGANDLLAIKEADIGVGIRNCDSSYAASFSIVELSGLDQIVRESKCCERSIIEIVRFICISSFHNIPLLIVMETEAVFFSSFQLIFVNLTKYILFPIFLAVSRSDEKQTEHKPSSNFLRMENMLMFWGNAIIGTVSILVIMAYYRSQPEYVRNTSTATIETGWVFDSSLVTSQFIFLNLYPIGLVYAVYVSSPWKEAIYSNLALFISILINLISSIAITFLIPQLGGVFNFTNMSMESIGFIFLITMVAILLTIVYSEVINWFKFYIARNPVIVPRKDDRELVERMESAEGTRAR